jgi:peptidyl-prolyl cis-trans isomerase D
MPEQLHVYAITIGVDPSSVPQQWTTAKARADDVLRQLKDGASFEEMARQYSTDASSRIGGDMGLIHRGSLSDEFEAALADLKPGHVSEVVQTLYGYHIARVAAIRPAQQKSFAEVAAQVEKDLTATRCADMNEAWTTRLRAGASIVLADVERPPG